MNNELTIIVPTHSRPNLLDNALSSARQIFKDDVDIIVGGNCFKCQIQNKNVSKKYNCKYFDLTEYEANIPQIYMHMLNEAKSKIILPLDDDDILTNIRLHHLAFKIALNKDALVSFNTIQYENGKSLLNIDRYIDTNEIDKLPILWNGQFQTGSMYYRRDFLIQAIERWKTNTNVLDISHDECWAMICMDIQKKYVHIPSVGLLVRKNESQSMNKQLAIFSSRSYIDEMANMLHLKKDTIDKWKFIQLRELEQICSNKLRSNVVFSNDRFKSIEKIITQQSQLKNYKQLRYNILKALNDIC